MKVGSEVIAKLDGVLKEHLEAQVVSLLGERLDLGANDALEIFYKSPIAKEIESGSYGIQYLSPEYIADEVIASMKCAGQGE